MKFGFTLLEVLVAMALFMLLLIMITLAVNPSRHLGEANDTRRFNDLQNILDAISEYTRDHHSELPSDAGNAHGAEITADYRFLEKDATGTGLDFCTILVETNYLPDLPVDPALEDDFSDCASDYHTGYQVKYADGFLFLHAPHAQEKEVTLRY